MGASIKGSSPSLPANTRQVDGKDMQPFEMVEMVPEDVGTSHTKDSYDHKT